MSVRAKEGSVEGVELGSHSDRPALSFGPLLQVSTAACPDSVSSFRAASGLCLCDFVPHSLFKEQVAKYTSCFALARALATT